MPDDTIRADMTEAVSPRRPAPLYAAREKVYPARVRGVFRRLKWAGLVVMLAVYYVVPWLRWDRGEGAPDQAVLIDIVNRRAYFFSVEIWPQELYFLVGLLVLAAVGLFFVTSLLGRVWCGYACPQTVWTDLFLWVEHKIEGDRNARMRLDRAPLSAAKAARKGAKHAVWLLIAALTGGAWIMYFNDAPTVTANILTGEASLRVYFFFGLFTATTYLLAGWAREQVCIYMCPWPRFQAAMFDEDTLIVTYQPWRGEPRGSHKKGEGWEGRGHCIDCSRCVQVCPTGIDIRNGTQLECIGCALCIDACDEVMDRIDLPRGLITYDTQRNQDLRVEGRPSGYRLVRPRTIVYSALLLAVAVVMAVGLFGRPTLDVAVVHDGTPLFVRLADGSIRNGYTVRVINKRREPRTFRVELEGIPGAELQAVGGVDLDGVPGLVARPGAVETLRLYVRAPQAGLAREATRASLAIVDIDTGERSAHDTVFRGPRR